MLTDLLAADLNALGETLTYLSARTALTIDYTTAAVAAARGGVQLTEGWQPFAPSCCDGNAAMPARGAPLRSAQGRQNFTRILQNRLT